MDIKVLDLYLAFCKSRDFEPTFKGLKRFNYFINYKEVK